MSDRNFISLDPIGTCIKLWTFKNYTSTIYKFYITIDNEIKHILILFLLHLLHISQNPFIKKLCLIVFFYSNFLPPLSQVHSLMITLDHTEFLPKLQVDMDIVQNKFYLISALHLSACF